MKNLILVLCIVCFYPFNVYTKNLSTYLKQDILNHAEIENKTNLINALSSATFETELRRPVPEESDCFGSSLSVFENTVVIGSPCHLSFAGQKESAFVYDYDGTSWNFTQELLPSDGLDGDFFGESVAIFGNTIAIGASFHEAPGANPGVIGAVYVYTHNGSSWSQITKVWQQSGITVGEFGRSVALNERFLAVGVPKDQIGVLGSVFIYDIENGFTFQLLIAENDNDISFNSFGLTVSLSNNTLFVGAPFNNDKGDGAGIVYVFKYNGTSWNQTQKLYAIDTNENDWFGFHVNVSNNRAVIGASRQDESGAVYVFDNDGSNWLETAKIKSDNPTPSFRFGYTTAIKGNRITVGEKGRSFIFEMINDQWHLEDTVTGLGGINYGQNVNLSDNRLFIDTDAGTIKIYKVPSNVVFLNGFE